MKIQPGYYRTEHDDVVQIVGRAHSLKSTFVWCGLVDAEEPDAWDDHGCCVTPGRDIVETAHSPVGRRCDDPDCAEHNPKGE